jgi:hypothetical protein
MEVEHDAPNAYHTEYVYLDVVERNRFAEGLYDDLIRACSLHAPTPLTPPAPPPAPPESTEALCCICLETDLVARVSLPCEHVVHSACMYMWSLQSRTCPMCRRRL